MSPIEIMTSLAELTKSGWVRQVKSHNGPTEFELNNNISLTYHPRGLVTLISGVKRSTMTMGQEEGNISLNGYVIHKKRKPETRDNRSWTIDENKGDRKRDNGQ
jgi:hypothetical protein